jgi:hypothetical protein
VIINNRTSNAPNSWQAQVAQALFTPSPCEGLPVRFLRLSLDWLPARSTHKTAQPKVPVLHAAFAEGARSYKMDARSSRGAKSLRVRIAGRG